MAEETLASASNALAQTYAEKITRTWNRTGELARNLSVVAGGGIGGGKNVAWQVEMDGASAVDFAEGSDVTSGEFDFDPFQDAILPWGQYRASFEISNLMINALGNSVGNAGALDDLWGERVFGKAAKLLDRINSDLYVGTGTGTQGNPCIIGLQTALAATGTYAGLSKSTYPEWAGNVGANGGIPRQLTMNVLSTTENIGFIAHNAQINAWFTSAGLRTKYEMLFEQIKRVVSDGGAIQAYNGGAKDYFWRGNPILRDRQNPIGNMFGLDMTQIELRVLPWVPVTDGVPVGVRDIPSSNGTDVKGTGIPVHIYPLGRTGSGVKFVLEIYAQLKVTLPEAHIVVTDVSES
jgi:hypothetical protein